MIRSLYLHAGTAMQASTARRLGLSESRVSQAHTESLTILRESIREAR